VVQAPPAQPPSGGTVTISLSCNETCAIETLSRGLPIATPVLVPGEPVLLPVLLRPEDGRALERRLRRRGRAELPLRVTVKDPARNRTTVPVTVTLAR
jgi:hypothetical protein